MPPDDNPSWLRYEPVFRSIVEHAWDMLVVLDDQYHVLYSSPSTAQVIGYHPDALRGRYAPSFLHPAERPRVLETLNRALHRPNQPVWFTHRIRDPEGKWRTMDSVVKNLLHDPEVSGLVIHSQDVTERVSLRRELHRIRLEALRMRVHPHMIYNLLHSIRICVQHDPKAAQEMIVMVGELLRLSFRHVDQEEVTLAQELAVVRQYFEVEQIRFGPQLAATFELEAEVEHALVPSLILQPVVENAIHHGLAEREGAGTIHFSAWREGERLHLRVEDDGVGLTGSDVEQDSGIGLSNIRLRLEQLYGKEAQLVLGDGDKGGACIHIELPFRTEHHRA